MLAFFVSNHRTWQPSRVGDDRGGSYGPLERLPFFMGGNPTMNIILVFTRNRAVYAGGACLPDSNKPNHERGDNS